MNLPPQIALAAEMSAQGKPHKIGRPTDATKRWLTDNATDYSTKGKWETHVVPASIANNQRHFLAHQVPSPFTVVIPNHLYRK